MAKYIVLYNKLSNEGKAEKVWEKISRQYPQLVEHAFDVMQVKDIVHLLQKNSPEMIVIAGGDGTINSVCKAVLQLSKKPKIAILPLGFGNALSYCFGVETVEKALAVINHPKEMVEIDIMKTNFPQRPLGLFNISAGFDARIVHNHNTRRYIGFRSFSLSLVQSLFFHPHSEITFTIDHKVTLSALASSLMVANGPSIGYNYLVAPESKLNDGLLDCTLFSTKYAYLTNLRLRGFKHPLYSRLGKVHFKASHIKIEGEPYVQIDGDHLEQHDGLEIALVKKQLTFFFNKEGVSDQKNLPFII